MSASGTAVPREVLSLCAEPQHRQRILQFIAGELAAADAREQSKSTEEQFRHEQGERANRQEELRRCAADVVYWLEHWGWTYDPRLVGRKAGENDQDRAGAYIRFKPWPRQIEFLRWIEDRVALDEPGLVEKSRDQGATYLAMAFALHRWLFVSGFKTSCTSMTDDKVDRLNDADSMFEKLRIMLRRLPAWMLPDGFSWHHHSLEKRLINPANGNSITGEAGDEAGRSGRSSMYLVDEASGLPRAESVEAALSGNTDCVIWMSTVRVGGLGNFFARKRFGGNLSPGQIFRLHYLSDPRKDKAWADEKRRSLTNDLTWETEFEINYTADSEGICIPAKWVQAAQRLRRLEIERAERDNHPVKLKIGRRRIAGLDVGAGKAKSVYVDRAGPVVGKPQSRGDPNTTGTAHWALDLARARQATVLNYDANGPGIGVTSTLSNADTEGLTVVPVMAGGSPTDRLWPDERTSKDMFANLRAELWWIGRTKFEMTYEHVLWLEGQEGGVDHTEEIQDLIALSDDPTLAAQLSLPKWTKNDRGTKILIESKESMAKRGIPSPDYADAFIQTLLEPEDDEANGIFKRQWFRLWPNGKAFPDFNFVLLSVRTAFDDERHAANETASIGVYGVFNLKQQFTELERRRMGINAQADYAALLCDFYAEKMAFPSLLERVREMYRTKFGSGDANKVKRRPDVVIVEEGAKADRSVRQSLIQFGVPAWPFAHEVSQVMRAHQAAAFVQQGHIFVPESGNEQRKGSVRDWAEPLIKASCSFVGRGAQTHPAAVDQLSMALIYLAQRQTIKAVPQHRAMPDPDEIEEEKQKRALEESSRERRRNRSAYGV